MLQLGFRVSKSAHPSEHHPGGAWQLCHIWLSVRADTNTNRFGASAPPNEKRCWCISLFFTWFCVAWTRSACADMCGTHGRCYRTDGVGGFGGSCGGIAFVELAHMVDATHGGVGWVVWASPK